MFKITLLLPCIYSLKEQEFREQNNPFIKYIYIKSLIYL